MTLKKCHLAGVLGAVALILSPSLLYPFGRDQAVFADVARVILDGGVPYRDVWEIKPPGVYLVYAAIAALLGPSMAAVRAMDLCVQIGVAATLYLLGRRLVGGGVAAVGALWYAVLYLRGGYWSMAQAEGFANLATLLALALCLDRRRAGRGRRWLMAGVLSGGVALLKYPLLLPCLAGLIWDAARGSRSDGSARFDGGRVAKRRPLAFWRRKGDRRCRVERPPSTARRQRGGRCHAVSADPGDRRCASDVHCVTRSDAPSRFGGGRVTDAAASDVRLRRHAASEGAGGQLASFLLGAALPPAAAAIWLAAAGGWGPYLEIQREFVAPYARWVHGEASWVARAWEGVRGFATGNTFPCLLAVAGAVVLARRRAASFIALWLTLALAAVAVQGKYFGYHWIPALLPLALLAAAGAEPLASLFVRRVPCPVRHAARRTALSYLLLLAWLLFSEGEAYRDAARVVTGRLPQETYWARFGRLGRGDYSFLATRQAARHVAATTRHGDGVFVWGFEPLVYVMSGRQPPTRFHFAVPLVSPWAPARWREELLRDLEARPPALILVLRNDAIPWASGRADDSWEQLKRFPELAAFLKAGYRFERQIEDFSLFRRRREGTFLFPSPRPLGESGR